MKPREGLLASDSPVPLARLKLRRTVARAGRWIERRGRLGRSLAEVARRLFRDGAFFEKTMCVTALDVDRFRPRYLERRSSAEIFEATRSEISSWPSRMGARLDQRVLRWLDAGDRVYVAAEGGSLVGYITVMFGSYRDDEGLSISIGPGEAKIRDVFVADSHRMTALPGMLHDTAVLCAQRGGASRVIGSVLVDNHGSLRASRHFGYREIRRVRSRRVLYYLRWSRDLWRAPDRAQGRPLPRSRARKPARSRSPRTPEPLG